MNKRAIVVAVVGIVLALAVLAVFLEPSMTALGFLRGDKFYQGRSASYWRRLLRSDDPSSLESPELVPFLVEALGDSNPTVRARAANALGGIGPAARAAVPALVDLTKDAHGNLDQDTLKYIQTAKKLMAENPGAKLNLEFDTPEEAARYAAADALLKIDPAAAKQAGLP
jgi:HEAT repeat protein